MGALINELGLLIAPPLVGARRVGVLRSRSPRGSRAAGSAVAIWGVRTRHHPSRHRPSRAIAAAVRAHWGFGVARTCRRLRRRGGRRGAAAIRARSARVRAGRDGGRPLELAYRMDVRPLLEQVRAPTVVVHRRADRAIPYACGRDLAGLHPGGAACERPRDAHLPWVGDWMSVSRALGSFLTGYPRSRPRRGRAAVATRARGPHACRRRAEPPRDRRTHRGQPSHRAPSCREHQDNSGIPRRSGRRSRPSSATTRFGHRRQMTGRGDARPAPSGSSSRA